MPSTRKQKDKEKRSRQSDVISHLENIDVMLGAFSWNEIDSNLENENEVGMESSGPRLNFIANCKDVRPLLNTTSEENSDATIKTARLINSEVTTQNTRKLEELKRDLNSQISESITAEIIEKKLPSFQNTIKAQETGIQAEVDQRVRGLSRNTECKIAKSTWESRSKPVLASSSQNHFTREDSTRSQESGCDDDTKDILNFSRQCQSWIELGFFSFGKVFRNTRKKMI